MCAVYGISKAGPGLSLIPQGIKALSTNMLGHAADIVGIMAVNCASFRVLAAMWLAGRSVYSAI